MRNSSSILFSTLYIIAFRLFAVQAANEQETFNAFTRILQSQIFQKNVQQSEGHQPTIQYKYDAFQRKNKQRQSKAQNQVDHTSNNQNVQQNTPIFVGDVFFAILFAIVALTLLIPFVLICVIQPLYHRITGKHLPCFRQPPQPPFIANNRGVNINDRQYTLSKYQKPQWKNLAAFQTPDSALLCSICLDQCCNVKLSCDHYFHLKCICQWIKKNSSCPVCRISQFSAQYYCIFCCGQYFCSKCVGYIHFLEFQSIKKLMLYYKFDQNGYQCDRQCIKQRKTLVQAKITSKNIQLKKMEQHNARSGKNKQLIIFQDVQVPYSQRPMNSGQASLNINS